MKKIIYYFLMLPMLFAGVACFTSCSEEDVKKEKNSVLNEEDSKKELENIASQLCDEFVASDFENILDLAEYISQECEKYDAEDHEEWLNDILNGFKKLKEHNGLYPTYEIYYRLSAFKGKFVANENSHRLERSESDNLSLHIKDQNGNPCEVIITTSGKTKTVYCATDTDYNYNYGWDENYNYYWNETIEDVEKYYIEVPEKVTAVLKQNGIKLAELVINTDLSSMVGENFNLYKDKYSANATAYFNGYTLSLENLYYENKQESKIAFNFKHGNRTLISANISATPEIYITDFEEEWEDEDINSKNNIVTINILDEMQIKGSCNNLSRLIEALDEEWGVNTDSKVNKYFNIDVFFNNSGEASAKIELESTKEEYYEYQYVYNPYTGNYEPQYVCMTDYDLMPVIVFNDGSRNSIEDFFNEEDFENTISVLKSLYKDFEMLFKGYDFDF